MATEAPTGAGAEQPIGISDKIRIQKIARLMVDIVFMGMEKWE